MLWQSKLIRVSHTRERVKIDGLDSASSYDFKLSSLDPFNPDRSLLLNLLRAEGDYDYNRGTKESIFSRLAVRALSFLPAIRLNDGIKLLEGWDVSGFSSLFLSLLDFVSVKGVNARQIVNDLANLFSDTVRAELLLLNNNSIDVNRFLGTLSEDFKDFFERKLDFTKFQLLDKFH